MGRRRKRRTATFIKAVVNLPTGCSQSKRNELKLSYRSLFLQFHSSFCQRKVPIMRSASLVQPFSCEVFTCEKLFRKVPKASLCHKTLPNKIAVIPLLVAFPLSFFLVLLIFIFLRFLSTPFYAMEHESLVSLNASRTTFHNHNVHIVCHDSRAREVVLLCVHFHFIPRLCITQTANSEKSHMNTIRCVLFKFLCQFLAALFFREHHGCVVLLMLFLAKIHLRFDNGFHLGGVCYSLCTQYSHEIADLHFRSRCLHEAQSNLLCFLFHLCSSSLATHFLPLFFGQVNRGSDNFVCFWRLKCNWMLY
eukprot:m.82446 g.82446  ORF g.82446 m.82446 type:complete len:306 (+) comp14295_c0_seq1:185-1102(+)